MLWSPSNQSFNNRPSKRLFVHHANTESFNFSLDVLCCFILLSDLIQLECFDDTDTLVWGENVMEMKTDLFTYDDIIPCDGQRRIVSIRAGKLFAEMLSVSTISPLEKRFDIFYLLVGFSSLLCVYFGTISGAISFMHGKRLSFKLCYFYRKFTGRCRQLWDEELS